MLPANITLSQLDRIFSVGGERVLSALVANLTEMRRWDVVIMVRPGTIASKAALEHLQKHNGNLLAHT